jgi:hypothetical protein
MLYSCPFIVWENIKCVRAISFPGLNVWGTGVVRSSGTGVSLIPTMMWAGSREGWTSAPAYKFLHNISGKTTQIFHVHTLMKSSIVNILRSHSSTKTRTFSLCISSCTASGVNGHLRSHILSGSSRRMPTVSVAPEYGRADPAAASRLLRERVDRVDRTRTVMSY